MARCVDIALALAVAVLVLVLVCVSTSPRQERSFCLLRSLLSRAHTSQLNGNPRRCEGMRTVERVAPVSWRLLAQREAYIEPGGAKFESDARKANLALLLFALLLYMSIFS